VAPDLPGHGFSGPWSGSPTPERLFGAVSEALDAVVDERMVLVGSSLGGALALRYAMERPERLVALALISPAGARTTLDDLPTPASLGALAMPILLLWGQSERLLPASSLAYFRRHLPEHAVIEEPKGFGQSPHFDDPARLAARLIAFGGRRLQAMRSMALHRPRRSPSVVLVAEQ
jgi:pimeloyl-ACP methyl ester carboxylesterase